MQIKMLKIAEKYHVPLIYIVLALTTFVAYEPVRHNEFLNYDDNVYVTENTQIISGFTTESIVSAFTKPHAANWHPVTWLSHILDCQLFGLNPLWHHMTNLFFHIANTLLLFAIFRKMTGNIWPSAFVAAAFALHPLHVESVAWVAERKDVLSTFFWLLIMAAYIRYTKRPRLGSYLLVFLLLAFGLMAKSMLVTLPIVLLFMDYWPLERFQRLGLSRLVREKIPLFILSIASSVITFIAQKSGGALSSIGALPLNFRVSNALVAYVRYIGKMIYPVRLAVLYPIPVKLSYPAWQLVLSLVLLLIVSAVVVILVRRRKYLLTGWLWYLATLVPVIGLVQVGAQAIADRYTYVPSIGIFIIAAWGIAEISAKLPYKKIILGVAALAIFTSLIICTRSQVKLWKDTFTLYEHALEVTENNHVVYYSLGILYAHQKKYDDAVEHWKYALEIYPSDRKALIALADLLAHQGNLAQAIEHWQYAVKLEPENTTIRTSLANALLHTGKADQAIPHYQETLRLNPKQILTNNTLAELLFAKGEIREAIERWQYVLKLQPNSPPVLNNLAWVMSAYADEKFRNPSQALEYAQKACKLTDDKYPDFLDTLAIAYAANGKFEEAVQTAEKAWGLYQNSGQEKKAKDLESRIELFKKSQPYRDKP